MKRRIEPIRSRKDIITIAKILEKEPRNHLLFVMGVNNGLRLKDLLKLRFGDVGSLRPGERFWLKENKTGKDNFLVITKSIHKSLRRLADVRKPADDEYLFASRKGDNKPISIQHVNYLIKKWTLAINLRGNYGAYTLRKTFGYILRKEKGIGYEIIAKRYNHSSPAVTMRYLGITEDEVADIIMDEIV